MEFEKLQAIIGDVFSVDISTVRKNTSFINDLGADSLEMFQVVMGVEAEFDIVLKEEQLKDIKTVGELYELIAG